MFRALLWKEWRELWVLPAAAVPLAAMSFFLTKTAAERLTPVVWETGFALWLLVAAVYIPTHLFVREREMDTAGFLFAKPLDRFRLWWFRLCVGIAMLAVVGTTLFIVVAILGRFYHTENPYWLFQERTIRQSILHYQLLVTNREGSFIPSAGRVTCVCRVSDGRMPSTPDVCTCFAR